VNEPRPITDADREELTAYLDGEADATTRARVEARLKRDPAMRAEADTLRATWGLLDQLPRPEPSEAFTSRTLNRITALQPAVGSTTLRLPAAARRLPWAMVAVGAAGLTLGWCLTGVVVPPRGPEPLRIDDPQVVRELRLLDGLPLYASVETLEFLQGLDHPDRFAEDAFAP
jgi:anti-sigma factor RsiW